MLKPTLLLLASLAMAQAGVNIPVRCDTLANGLRILMVPDTNVAVVSCRLYYFTGSMYEGPGSTGLSHMFEHMMFKGTKTLGTVSYAKEKPFMDKIDQLEERREKLRATGLADTALAVKSLQDSIFATLDKQRAYIKKDEIWDLYLSGGGSNLNAWTSDDITAYIVTLPKNKLELFAWIESDRMRNPILREFDSERDVVAEERRMRYDNRPIGAYTERLNGLFYTAHPYRQPTVGYMSDIQHYTRKMLADRVKQYYTPDNALLVLVGNLDHDKTLPILKRYFGSIPAAAVKPPIVVTREPDPIGITRFSMENSSQPRIDLMWHTPGYPNDDLYRLDIAAEVLSGRSGRLYNRLVTKLGLCSSVDAGNEFRLHNGEFDISATLNNGVSPDTVEKIILEEVEKLAKTPPTLEELERVKNSMTMGYAAGLRSLEGISDQLARFELLGSYTDMFSYTEKIEKTDPATIPLAVARWLKSSVRTVGTITNPIGASK